jgi:hypothetical protein
MQYSLAEIYTKTTFRKPWLTSASRLRLSSNSQLIRSSGGFYSLMMGGMRVPLPDCIGKSSTSAQRYVNFHSTFLLIDHDGMVKPLPSTRSFGVITTNPCGGVVGVRDRHQ